VKRLFLFLLFLGLMLPISLASAQTNQSSFIIGSSVANINGVQTNCFATPYIENNRTFLAIRDIAGALGVNQNNVFWEGTKNTVTLTKGDKVVQLTIGSNVIMINGIAITMDVAPEVGPTDRTMLPASFVAQAFGAIAVYNDADQTVTIQLAEIPNSETLPSNISPNNLSEITVPSLAYSNIQTENKDFEWTYGENTFKWHVEVPAELINWDRQVNNITQQFYSSNGLGQEQILNYESNISDLILSDSVNENSNLIPWTNETINSQWVGYLAQDLDASARSAGYDYFHEADYILSFIGSAIPYTVTAYPELPAQTLVDSGDCKDKSILYASILKSLGYKVALLAFSPPAGQFTGHMAVGIVFNDNQIPLYDKASYYSYDGVKYYFAETTASNWHVGQISDQEMEKQGTVYPLN
jgi:hypothetical protein